MDHVQALIARHFDATAGELSVGDVAVSGIVDRFGSPLFVYDAAVLDRKWTQLRAALPQEFQIYYSVKANPNRAILRRFIEKGCGLEIASAGEFHQALQAGCSPGHILFAGPGKTEAELEFVLKQGIGELHAESLLEIKRVGAICRRLGTHARVALRINPSGEAQGGAMRMGGKSAPFGIDEEQVEGVLDQVLSESALEFQGIHLFAGTQILDDAILVNQYRKGLEIAKRVAHRLQRPLHTVDFGGGLGIPYFAHEQTLNLDRLRESLRAMMDGIRRDPMFAGTTFIVEPGRFLVGESGIYVTRITDIKVSRGKTFLILDGGMNHHLAASGNLGQVIKRNFPVAILNKLDKEATEVVDLVGPLCTPLDTLARDVSLPKAEVGDLVGVFQSGAYARAASPLGFLSHPTPCEVMVQDGQLREIRRRGTYEAMTADMS